MTRINANIPMELLSDKLLVSEIEELPRILYHILCRIEANKQFDDIPKNFCLGTGHIKFFFDKCFFLFDRYKHLIDEYEKRSKQKYNQIRYNQVINRYLKISRLKPILCQDWIASKENNELIINRILEKSKNYKNHYYYGKKIIDWNKFMNRQTITN